MSDVHMIAELPDGTAIGADDDTAIYRGERIEVPFDQMTVTTTVADDGLSFTRVITLPDGSIFGHGTADYDGFTRVARITAQVDGEDIDEAQLRAAWETECAISSLDPSPSAPLVWQWTKEGV